MVVEKSKKIKKSQNESWHIIPSFWNYLLAEVQLSNTYACHAFIAICVQRSCWLWWLSVQMSKWGFFAFLFQWLTHDETQIPFVVFSIFISWIFPLYSLLWNSLTQSLKSQLTAVTLLYYMEYASITRIDCSNIFYIIKLHL